MYIGNGNINSIENYSDFIKDYDIFNSRFLYLINNKVVYSESNISRQKERLDLISQDLYGDSKYSGLLSLFNNGKISPHDFKDVSSVSYSSISTLGNYI